MNTTNTLTAPFTILIDSGEQHPWTFENIVPDKTQLIGKLRKMKPQDVKFDIPTKRAYLGHGKADYALEGHEGQIHIERKSIADFQGTMLSHGARAESFKRELEYLNQINHAWVIVEGSQRQAIMEPPAHGKRTKQENIKTINRRMLSYQLKYPRVHWLFPGCRRSAELNAVRIFQLWHRHQGQVSDTPGPQEFYERKNINMTDAPF